MPAPSLAVARIFIISLLLAFLVTALNVPDGLSSFLAAHPISTISGDLAKAPVDLSYLNTKTVVDANSARSRCPASCNDAGLDSTNWTVYQDVNRLSWCNQTMLLDFALYNSINDPRTHASIRCCAAGPEVAISSGADPSPEATANRVSRRDYTSGGVSCLSKGTQTQIQESLQMASNGSDALGSVSAFVEASQQMASYLAQQKPNCDQKVAFTYSGSAVVGLFAGSGIQSQGIAASMLQKFIASVQSSGYSKSVLVQLCSGDGRSSRYSMGIIANSDADVGSVQDAVATWASGGCITTYDRADIWQNITMLIPELPTSTDGTSNDGVFSATHAVLALAPRTTCSTIKVAAGDTCKSSQSFETWTDLLIFPMIGTTLASECGITPAEFTTYNPEPNECSTLTVGEHVCCSSGTLPDFAPQPYANGTCATYLVVAGDSCSEIAATNSLTVDQLSGFNNNTWGWMGCTDLLAGGLICLSSGSPPMPAVVKNAVCGPQVPGTPIPPAGTNLSTLNPCPLNSCCDIWGQVRVISFLSFLSEKSRAVVRHDNEL